MLLLSSDALTVAASRPSHGFCDCAAMGFDECHCNDYLLPAAIVAEDPGETTVPQFTPIESIAEWIRWSGGLAIVAGDPTDDDDDRTQGDDGDYGPFEVTAEDPTDDPHDDRNGGSGKGSVALLGIGNGLLTQHLERCFEITAWVNCPCEDADDNYQCPWCN